MQPWVVVGTGLPPHEQGRVPQAGRVKQWPLRLLNLARPQAPQGSRCVALAPLMVRLGSLLLHPGVVSGLQGPPGCAGHGSVLRGGSPGASPSAVSVFQGMKVFFMVVAAVYVSYLLFLVVRACSELRHMPYVGERPKGAAIPAGGPVGDWPFGGRRLGGSQHRESHGVGERPGPAAGTLTGVGVSHLPMGLSPVGPHRRGTGAHWKPAGPASSELPGLSGLVGWGLLEGWLSFVTVSEIRGGTEFANGSMSFFFRSQVKVSDGVDLPSARH